ncbi:hypothetical protein SELMODRAFT_407641 [Selaginella moellendorffii]|uniref:RING-type domain-containing protein n=1 Tax=Selaginella moellendorffii TaxID=88036 RepID=D8R696_SELML|nr:hypothetical protein SELMODRAFT_407641 [Selaginella moellendorffii]
MRRKKRPHKKRARKRSRVCGKRKGKTICKGEMICSDSGLGAIKKRVEVATSNKEDEPTSATAGASACGICFTDDRERGKLDCCDHFFCFGCIVEWSKLESRCPMCKQRFMTIVRSTHPGQPASRSRTIHVPMRDQVYEPSDEEVRDLSDPYANIVCVQCQEIGDEGLLLLCDLCDSAAHTYCVGLGVSVPRGDWFCQCCRASFLGSPNLSITAAPTQEHQPSAHQHAQQQHPLETT